MKVRIALKIVGRVYSGKIDIYRHGSVSRAWIRYHKWMRCNGHRFEWDGTKWVKLP